MQTWYLVTAEIDNFKFTSRLSYSVWVVPILTYRHFLFFIFSPELKLIFKNTRLSKVSILLLIRAGEILTFTYGCINIVLPIIIYRPKDLDTHHNNISYERFYRHKI